MAHLFEQMLAADTVQTAWRRLRRDKAPWSPGIDRQELERELPRHLLGLVEDLRHGRYRPLAMRQFPITKGDGSRRILSVQFLRDKLAQRMALQVLEPHIDPFLHPDSFGYRTGRGVPHAVTRVRERIGTGLPWLVDGDIRSFFDRVPHRGIQRAVAQFVADRPLRRLIQLWLAAGYHSGSLLGARRGVPQGAVISPLLCNLFLHRLDTAWQRANIPFVRYADDFLLLTPRASVAHDALDFTELTLRRLGLALHPDKTQICRASPQVVFLGEPVVRQRRQRSRRRS